jgi:outer membrane protein assembly factor BamB
MKEGEEEKVSNDNPARPLQMPPASTEVKEAFDDFERFQRRGAWERALKALYTIPEQQAARFVDGDNGFVVPVARKRRQVLAALPPAGQSAYRLFYDAEAKKLFDEAKGDSEQKNLERVYSAYFTTSVGDNAADRLGDLYFEQGRFDRAADCWLAVLRECPDSDLSPASLTLKAALALERAGRRAEFSEAKSDLESRFRDEKVTLGGETAPAVELLRRWTKTDHAAPAPAPDASSAGPKPNLAAPIDPIWQMRFAESVEAGMVPLELKQWEAHTLSGAVPAAAIEGSKLFVNYLGFVFAIDLKTGKLLWRTEPLHHLKLLMVQDYTRWVDATRFSIAVAGDYVCAVSRSLKDTNMMAAYALTCYRAEGGQVVWQSSDLADYNQLDMNGPPIVADGKFDIPAKTQLNPQQQRQAQQYVLAIEPHDGKVLWKADVATYRQNERYFYYYARDQDPQPRLVERRGSLYIDTHQGVLTRLDSDSGDIDWGYGYRTDPVQSQFRFFFYDEPQEAKSAGGPPTPVGESLLVKGMKSDRISAIEPERLKVDWDRPVTKSSRLLGAGQRALYLGGDELSAIDLKTRQLLWAARLPGDSRNARVVVRPDGLWQLTPRGIYEIDPETGAVRHIFRGADLGSAGGDLLLSDELLVAVSNRAITAYPRQPGKEKGSHE